jgi:NAD+ synthase
VGIRLRKKGIVVAVSGGIDSSTTAALCAQAIGRDRVFALLLPERDSSDDSVRLGKLIVEHLGIDHQVVDIASTLEAMGCYRYRDEAIRELFPEYTSSYKSKIVLSGTKTTGPGVNFFSVVIQGPDGPQKTQRLPLSNYLQIVAATNMKQRMRKSLEYFHADRLNYAVAGTPNFLEYDQGFFVKNGDGAADLKPIAHLYKTQVYMMAKHLELPPEILEQRPTTDTYSLAQTQEEFFFQLPLQTLDLILFGLENGVDYPEISTATGISVADLQWVIVNIERKRQTTASLHLPPLSLVVRKAHDPQGIN